MNNRLERHRAAGWTIAEPLEWGVTGADAQGPAGAVVESVALRSGTRISKHGRSAEQAAEALADALDRDWPTVGERTPCSEPACPGTMRLEPRPAPGSEGIGSGGRAGPGRPRPLVWQCNRDPRHRRKERDEP